jgi:hypothetical protein
LLWSRIVELSEMRRARIPLTLCLLVGLAGGGTGRALGAPAAPARQGDLAVERLRLRTELDRVNAEIDALKRAGHGVSDDYRLRARLADAEALARRLVDIERRMGLTAPPPAAPRPLPSAAPTDGPADLQAKADILTDQARRVRAAADALAGRVSVLEGRQELRRRAADLDRDPFAPLEGSKRRTVSVAAPDGTRAAAPSAGGDRAGAQTPPGGAAAPGLSPGVPGVSSQTASIGATTSGGAPAPLTAAPPTLSVELRDMLDPATVADIGRLEHGRAPSSLPALRRAVAALRARAAAIDAQARSMRQAAANP